jgi:Holliday junction DNA helicase RuvA
VTSDLVSALVNLGYREAQAEAAARTATEHLGEDAAFELLFREALKALRSG